MKISVIIPVYNVEKYIARCIDSILSQTFQDFEIVIVNDCTPDKSMEIVRRYTEQDNRIRIFNHDENMGLMWTRKTGYTNAKGEYLMFCDSDDYMPKNALEVLYNAIIKTKADIVVGQMQRADQNGLSHISSNTLNYGNDKIGVYKSLLLIELSQSLCGKIYNAKLFKAETYKCFKNLTLGEDGDLLYQIVRHVNDVQLVDDVVYYYYCNTTSSTHEKLSDRKLKDSIFSWDYRSNFVRDIEDIQYALYKSEARVFVRMLRQNYDKDKILKYSTIPNLRRYSEYGELKKYYKGVELLLNYILVNSKTVRKLINIHHGR